MKTIVALIFAVFCATAMAGELPDLGEPTSRYDLTKGQVLAESAFAGLMFLDYRQTLDIKGFCRRRFPNVGTANPDGSVTDGNTVYCSVHETNPGLGKNPSDTKVTLYFGGLTLVHAGVAKVLPNEWRPWWIGGGIALQLLQVIKNKKFGLSTNF